MHFRKLEGEGPEDGWVCVRVRGKKVARSVQVGDGVHWCANALVFPENWDGHWEWGFGTKLPNEINDGLWEKLVEYDLKNYLFVCHWFMSEKEKDLNEKYNIAEGLVCGHEYSILGAREVCGERLVCIRNPWGRGCDWQGPWSDQSEEWEANPDIAKALDYKNLSDGKFWMDFDDFCRCWSRVFVCRKEMPVGRDSFETERQKHKDASPEAEECYIVVAGGAVKGSFTDLEEAKALLNEYPSQAPQPFRMVCAAQYGKVLEDPHTVGGQNQGAGVAAGFNKAWRGWTEIREMNKIAQEYLVNQQQSQEAQTEDQKCYIVVAGGAVKGSFTDLEEAKALLNSYPSQAPQPFRMVCAAQYGKVLEDPHTVGGQNQGAGVAAGFNKAWRGWTEIREMNKIAQEYLVNQQQSQEAQTEDQECYIVVAGGAVKGSFTDLEEAKALLNSYPSQAPQPFRMVCAAQYGKVQDDPHTVAGQNQGAGVAAGFNKAWRGWPEIRKMNKIAQEFLLEQAV